MNISFVTDSTSDIPANLTRQYDIEVIPTLITIGGENFKDGVGLSREDFYRQLPSLDPVPTTASPSVGVFQECYQRKLQAGADRIISIHPPNQLSGIFNAARLAAAAFGGRVTVLDCGQISLGMGFQVLMAAEAASRGALLGELLDLLNSIKRRVRLAALLDSIEYIRRSGRVSWAMAMIGGVLRLKPLIELRHGIVHRLGQVRTRLQGVERLMEELDSWGSLERLAILHSNAEESALELLEKVRTKVASLPLVVNVTTVIGTHVGPNGLGFVAVPLKD